ncbi:MAG: VOC family protein [Anaerolineaceae bacterium]|nr:VOC family protein [Anaerolineaceae bacterium]
MENLQRQPDQVGIVVYDLNAFLKSIKELIGMDGFEVIDYPPEGVDVGTTYHGDPSRLNMKVAFCDFGSIQLEVVQPGEGQNIYNDFLKERGPGLHHIRFTDKQFDQISEDFSRKGIKIISSGRGVHGNSQWAYFDTTKELQGLILEIRKPA